MPQVEELNGWGIKDIQLGMYHSVALSDKHVVYSWGSSAEGQLGHVNKTKEEQLPRVVDSLEGKGVEQISVGAFHSIALTAKPPPAPTPPSQRGKLGCTLL